MTFCPSGYVTVQEAIAKAALRWFTERIATLEAAVGGSITKDSPSNDVNPVTRLDAFVRAVGPPSISDDLLQQFGEILTLTEHRLRNCLHQGLLLGYYFGGLFHQGRQAVAREFWAMTEADGVLASGTYWPFGRPRTLYEQKPGYPLFFLESELTAFLSKSALDPADIRKRARIWRSNRSERFTARQRRVREWINFAEIAEWCSREDGSIQPNEKKRAAALDALERDLLAGEFDENGRSRVLFLSPESTRARMTRAWLKDAIEYNYDGHQGRSAYTAHCWIPRDLAQRWFERHRLSLPPWLTPSVLGSAQGAPASRPLASHIETPPEEISRPAAEGRKRGPRPRKLERAKEAMREDIRQGRQTTSSLRAMLEKELETIYQVSRDTARKARDAVLSEFVENSNRDK